MHLPSHFSLPSGHFFLVHLQVLESKDVLRGQLRVHSLPQRIVPSGQQTASAVTSRRRDRRPPSCCAAMPTGQASTHSPSLQFCPSPQQFVSPQRVVPFGQVTTHSSFSQVCPSLQQRLPHFFSGGQATQNPSTHA
jgi:hypothetical protein